MVALFLRRMMLFCNGPRSVQPLNRRQCSIHCESWRLRSGRRRSLVTPKGAQKRSIKET